MKGALVSGGRVVNVIEYTGDYPVPPGATLVPCDDAQVVEVGQLYDDSRGFTAPQAGVDELASHAANLRWRKETGGTTWNGYPVHTDRESQAKLNAAYVMARDGLWADGAGWKFADGLFRPLTATEAQDLAKTVSAHVQGCYAVEAQVLAEIEAGTITTREEVEAAFA